MIQIDHHNGIVTVYAHNSENLVAVGQSVKKGEIIAYMGSTGFSTGPHCHYEVRVNGSTVNPANFL
jgi:murein DD-endopeptidase MepM/ murein hydrolase activator NlpD